MSKAGKTSKNSSNDVEKKSTSTIIYKCKDIKMGNVVVSEINRTGTQPMAYINYTDPKINSETKILVQSGKFKLTGGGIPRLSKPDSSLESSESSSESSSSRG